MLHICPKGHLTGFRNCPTCLPAPATKPLAYIHVANKPEKVAAAVLKGAIKPNAAQRMLGMSRRTFAVLLNMVKRQQQGVA